MSEEIDINQLNLIEYEEFIQTEVTHHSIEDFEDQLDGEKDKENIEEIGKLLNVKND